jgi:hypothetical protein
LEGDRNFWQLSVWLSPLYPDQGSGSSPSGFSWKIFYARTNGDKNEQVKAGTLSSLWWKDKNKNP